MRITIWTEHSAQEEGRAVKKAYPNGMSSALADIFDGGEFEVNISSQGEPDFGLSQELLNKTDVLIYWAHGLHAKMGNDAVERIAKRVEEGMGVLFLHSAHFSKPFKKLMGTSGSLKWREDGKHERIYNVCPTHPIATGLPESFVIDKEEMYGKYFDIPTPDDLVFIGWYTGGEVFRSGFTYHYGKGKLFYFQPGHETYPVYYDKNVQKVISNAVLWLGGAEIPSQKTFVKDQCDFARPKERKYLKPKA